MKNEKPPNNLLKSIRKEKLLTQQQVADLLFVSKPTYASWENDNGKIPLCKFSKLIGFLEIEEAVIRHFLSNNVENQLLAKAEVSFEKDCLNEILNKINQIQKDIAVLK